MNKNNTIYQSDECPVLYAMSVIGQKWKIPILWHLASKGTLRFNQLRRGIAGITTIMLTKSLQELEAHGLVLRIQYDEVPPRVEYSLTERGKTLIPMLEMLNAWGRDQQCIDANENRQKSPK